MMNPIDVRPSPADPYAQLHRDLHAKFRRHMCAVSEFRVASIDGPIDYEKVANVNIHSQF